MSKTAPQAPTFSMICPMAPQELARTGDHLNAAMGSLELPELTRRALASGFKAFQTIVETKGGSDPNREMVLRLAEEQAIYRLEILNADEALTEAVVSDIAMPEIEVSRHAWAPDAQGRHRITIMETDRPQRHVP